MAIHRNIDDEFPVAGSVRQSVLSGVLEIFDDHEQHIREAGYDVILPDP